MLQIKNLSITHKKDLRPLLDHFTFSLNSGDKAVIISEEGNGKSTLLKLIYDSRLVDSYVEYTGDILTQGTLMGYLPQEFPPEYKEQTIYTYCTSIPAFSDRNPGELAAIAARLRLPKDIFYSDQLCGTLSGGEKVKLQIAGLQMCQPDIYLLDEPSNDIDIETLEWLEQFINTCGKPVLYVSHDRYFINRTASRILELENGSFTGYLGNYDYYLEKKAENTLSAPETDGAFPPAAGGSREGNPSSSAASSLKQDWQSQKEALAAQRKKENALKRCESEIERLEKRSMEIDEEMTHPDVCINVAKLQELAREKEQIEENLLLQMEEWESLSD